LLILILILNSAEMGGFLAPNFVFPKHWNLEGAITSPLPWHHDMNMHNTPRWKLEEIVFRVRVVKPWNPLPEFVISFTNIQTFESRLDKVWENQPVHFFLQGISPTLIIKIWTQRTYLSCFLYHR